MHSVYSLLLGVPMQISQGVTVNAVLHDGCTMKQWCLGSDGVEHGASSDAGTGEGQCRFLWMW